MTYISQIVYLEVPALRGGNYVIESTEPDWYTKEVMEEFVARAEKIHNGQVDPSVDYISQIVLLMGVPVANTMPLPPFNSDMADRGDNICHF